MMRTDAGSSTDSSNPSSAMAGICFATTPELVEFAIRIRNRNTRHAEIQISPGPIVMVLAVVGLSPPLQADDGPASAGRPRPGDATGLNLFKQKVRPVLIQHCLNCHGGNAKKGGLDLSDRKPLVESGVLDGGGKKSRLTAISGHQENPHMPQRRQNLPTRRSARSPDGSTWMRRE